MNNKTTTGLYWFRHDLRLTDNPTFTRLCSQVDRLICVYVNEQEKELGSDLIKAPIDQSKRAFGQQSVHALGKALNEKQQMLVIVDRPSHHAILDLIERYRVTHLGIDHYPGVNEVQAVAEIQQACPLVTLIMDRGHTLFSSDGLPFELENLPETFTPFRKKVENCIVAEPLKAPVTLPPPVITSEQLSSDKLSHQFIGSSLVNGGEEAGLAQLDDYLFNTDRIKHYKQTRNALDDWKSSSKLSFWLANGCLSVRTVYSAIKEYESQRGANESTYWLYFELLWREYFQWYLLKHRARLFHFSGVQQVSPSSNFDQQRFTRWCEGMTDFPIVNACMRQLKQTGYMSNRGRQLVASCFVHELNLDWRYGAAYFEQQLIDYDVASNWGNWQYLAGVGADPRGHRRFDLNKQANIYDPEHQFREKWLSSEYQ